jgi:hypothetical protein
MRRAAILLKVFALTACAFCQSTGAVPNISGKWVLEQGRSSFGQGGKPFEQVRIIKQSARKIEIVTKWITPVRRQGALLTTLVPDGKDHPASSQDYAFDTMARSRWDGDALVAEFVHTPASDAVPKSKWTHRYSLLSDGDTLIVDVHAVPGLASPFEQHLVFSRQK